VLPPSINNFSLQK